MNQQEKILKWAGFKQCIFDDERWWCPNTKTSETVHIKELNLDIIFKWIVPKIVYRFEIHKDADNEYMVIIRHPDYGTPPHAISKDISEAILQAVLQLIEKEALKSKYLSSGKG